MYSFQLLIIALVSATCWNWTNATGLTFTLNLTQLESSSGAGGNSAILGSKVYIHCLPGQESYSVYVTEDQTAFDNCDTNANYNSIGSCQNSPFEISIFTLSIIFGDLVSYEVGSQYYFYAFETSGGIITSNQPCLDGYKFSFRVISTPVPVTTSSSITMAPPNVMTISSSYIVYDTMSSVLSTTYELTSMVTDSTAAGSTSTQAAGTVRPPVTSTSTISASGHTASRSTTATFTTMTRRGTVVGTPETRRTESDPVAMYAGIGGGLVVVLIIIVVVVVIILIAVGVIVSRKRNRNNEPEKKNTFKKKIDNDYDDDNAKDTYGNNYVTGIPLNTLSSNGDRSA